MTIKIIGIPWYREQTYAACVAVMVDKHVLPDTYREWRESADRLVKQIEATGARAIRAEIDPKEFPAWCRANGLNVDAKARSEFAAAFAHRQTLD